MKKAMLISCTNHYNERTVFFENYFLKNGYECTYITSDFNHSTKSFYKLEKPNTIQIPTKSYKKNLSLSRIYSHLKFSKDVIKMVGQLNPDVLYIEIPPNSLSRQAIKYKKKKPNTKLIFDIFDMWPETFPSDKLKGLLKIPFSVWAWFRNCGLSCADVVFTECELFAKKLNQSLKEKECKVLYLCREKGLKETPTCQFDGDTLNLCYLGSINNIIDIETISNLIKNLSLYKKTVLHIIGDGESREQLISSAKESGAEVVFYGKVYDQEKKQEIFNQCSFGLNIMKESVFIGLTMKSVDYFSGGLPIINSIGGDTFKMVDTDGIGVNINRNDLNETAQKICNMNAEEVEKQKANVYNKFNLCFTVDAFENVLEDNL
ncbi:MAG: glycosyltransferase family 4 protein [Ruminococcaceae bacterium]|nr:glycosyltransferase family 4 protein [Oscillospiraceae bacterium]